MSWSPWQEVSRHPDILLHRCRLDEGLGWWCPADRVILLDDRLDPITARCVLAHELGHAVLNHRGCDDFMGSHWFARRLEAAADDWAAQRLVSVNDLMDGAALFAGDLVATAAHVEVTVPVLSRRLDRLGPVDRRLLADRGAGQLSAAS